MQVCRQWIELFRFKSALSIDSCRIVCNWVATSMGRTHGRWMDPTFTVMATPDSHWLANEPDLRESDTDSQGGPHMGPPQAIFFAGLLGGPSGPGATRDSHGLANEPDSRESDTDSHTPICESTKTELSPAQRCIQGVPERLHVGIKNLGLNPPLRVQHLGRSLLEIKWLIDSFIQSIIE